MIQGIEHAAIASADPRRLAQWYVDHLGFAINFEPPGVNAVFVEAPDGSMLEIIESDAAPEPHRMREPGFRHLALVVADMDAACRRLKAMGVAFLSEPVTVASNTTAFFTDCDGNILHLLHREKPLP